MEEQRLTVQAHGSLHEDGSHPPGITNTPLPAPSGTEPCEIRGTVSVSITTFAGDPAEGVIAHRNCPRIDPRTPEDPGDGIECEAGVTMTVKITTKTKQALAGKTRTRKKGLEQAVGCCQADANRSPLGALIPERF